MQHRQDREPRPSAPPLHQQEDPEPGAEAETEAEAELAVEVGFVTESREEAAAAEDGEAGSVFVSKVGGRPAPWLDPLRVPAADGLGACPHCGRAMALLLQLYAPLPARPDAFHRYLYLLACPDPACHAAARPCMRLLRCQLPRANPFWPPEVPQGEAPVQPAAAAACCAVCGLLGPHRCGQCRATHYCSRAHQAAHWRAGHDRLCKTAAPAGPAETAGWGFRQLFLVCEPEPPAGDDEAGDEEEEGEDGAEEDAGDLATQMEALRTASPAGAADVLGLEPEQYERTERDPAFARFERRMRRAPEQVLRYARWQNAAPVWVAAPEPEPSAVPPCGRCGAARAFEAQVLPQLLHFLRLDPRSGVDWGTLALYTCTGSCPPQTPDQPYAEEHVLRQLIVHAPAPDTAAARAPARRKRW